VKSKFFLFIGILVVVEGYVPQNHILHATTGATQRVYRAADAQGGHELVPEEDAGALSERLVTSDDDDRFIADLNVPHLYIEAYTNKKSYLPGDTIHFHVSTTDSTYDIEILKEQWQRVSVGKITGIKGAYYPVPPAEENPWENGAGWPVSYSWTVPEEWENGNYLALLRTTSGGYKYHPFVVRSHVPGSHSKVALVLNYGNRNAYNNWGGKSLYISMLPDDSRHGTAVSFLRPFTDSDGRGKHYWGSYELSSQLQADGFNPEFITELDISFNPAIMRAYDVVIFTGHHEYISRNVYDALEALHRRGGHLAFFSGNDIYWQVRFGDGGSKMVGYKDYALSQDPMVGIDNSLVTTLWSSNLLNRPAEALQGISYVDYSYLFEPEDYIVQDCNHFIFEGTGLRNGDALGWKMAADETDYVGPNSPPVMSILLSARRGRVRQGYESYAKVDHVDGAVIYYEDSPAYGYPKGRGGQVFSTGTTLGWGVSLESSSQGYETVRKVTHNIIQHMVDSPPPVPTFKDLAVFASHWLGKCNSPGWCDNADFDMSGIVDMRDFAYFAAYWSAN
jgi:hypothetical protein